MARPANLRRKRHTQSRTIERLPWRQGVNPHPPVEVLSADQIEAIHRASLRVLAEIGMRVDSEYVRKILADAGAEVDHESTIVRMDGAMIDEFMAHAPASFTIHACNPARDVVIGGNIITFEPVGGPQSRAKGKHESSGTGGPFLTAGKRASASPRMRREPAWRLTALSQ